MKIKRIVALVMSVILLCFTLVSCDDEIGSYLKNYPPKPEPIKDVYYDLYIVGGDSDDIARKTVNDKLNQSFYDKFHTKVIIHYMDEENYASELDAIVNPETPAAYSAPKGYENYRYGGKIVLINDYSMMNFLSGKLSPLDKYLEDTAFAKLNTQLPTSLLDAAEYFVGEGDEAVSKGTLAIPNNRRLGEFKYYVVNREIAENVLSFSALTEIHQITSSEAVAELVGAAGKKDTVVEEQDEKSNLHFYDGSLYFYEISGNYELKAEIEESGEWICNVVEVPVVTPEIAYGSAFGVIPEPNKDEDYTTVTITKEDGTKIEEKRLTLDFTQRAMQIIYEINADVTTRNILQYGVENTNYTLGTDKFVTPLTTTGSKYNMNIEYTGDVTKAYYFGTVWTPELVENVKKQNASAKLPE